MDSVDLELIERVQDLRDQRISVEWGLLEKEGFNSGRIRTLIKQGYLKDGGNNIYLTPKGTKLLMQYKQQKLLENFIQAKHQKEEIIKLREETSTFYTFIKDNRKVIFFDRTLTERAIEETNRIIKKAERIIGIEFGTIETTEKNRDYEEDIFFYPKIKSKLKAILAVIQSKEENDLILQEIPLLQKEIESLKEQLININEGNDINRIHESFTLISKGHHLASIMIISPVLIQRVDKMISREGLNKQKEMNKEKKEAELIKRLKKKGILHEDPKLGEKRIGERMITLLRLYRNVYNHQGDKTTDVIDALFFLSGVIKFLKAIYIPYIKQEGEV